MNLLKIRDWFNAEDLNCDCTVIGCGSVGSNIAIQLARCGVPTIRLYDDDCVESKNAVNQAFDIDDIGLLKTIALAEKIRKINPDCVIYTGGRVDENTKLSGFVFLCVDSIATRKKIAEANRYNHMISGMIDCRMSLGDCNIFCAKWQAADIKRFIGTMNYSDSDVVETRSICGGTIGAITDGYITTGLAVAQYINFMKGEEMKPFITVQGFKAYAEG